MLCSPLSDSSSVSLFSLCLCHTFSVSATIPLCSLLVPPCSRGGFPDCIWPPSLLCCPGSPLAVCPAGGRYAARAPPRSLSLPLQALSMTPPGRLYLLRVRGAPPLLLLGLLLALPPEAQVRQQENGVCGVAGQTLDPRATLHSLVP